MSDTICLFHVTSAQAALSIIKDGAVDPAFARAHAGRQWFCKASLVDKLIAFQIYRRNIPLREVIVFKCEVQREGLQDGARIGKYSSPFKAEVTHVYTMPEWCEFSVQTLNDHDAFYERTFGYGQPAEQG